MIGIEEEIDVTIAIVIEGPVIEVENVITGDPITAQETEIEGNEAGTDRMKVTWEDETVNVDADSLVLEFRI